MGVNYSYAVLKEKYEELYEQKKEATFWRKYYTDESKRLYSETLELKNKIKELEKQLYEKNLLLNARVELLVKAMSER